MNYRTARRALLVIPALTVAGLAIATMPASAQPSAASISCSKLSVATDITPALGAVASPITAAGEGGTATCSGTVDDTIIDSAVAGVFGLTASSDSSSCDNVGGGAGHFTLDVTDTSGTHHAVEGDFTWQAGAQGAVSLSGGLSAVGGLRPITGDCATTPLSRASFELANGSVNV